MEVPDPRKRDASAPLDRRTLDPRGATGRVGGDTGCDAAALRSAASCAANSSLSTGAALPPLTNALDSRSVERRDARHSRLVAAAATAETVAAVELVAKDRSVPAATVAWAVTGRGGASVPLPRADIPPLVALAPHVLSLN
mmetsp:Transcript_31239/g.100875  ORF Transcript_31239/g.100875 Transcript_31239/m.100875 type:complete len:141 (-) Transcript_31239:258-680(-)|eukprot:scaffold3347_cov110-Isochrysis_galbana.AAC.3